ncbi:MAG: hypothetical protein HGN29_09980 [Asgard group archaeon]|nr:hypothetical protein [Asgard group archaeon]
MNKEKFDYMWPYSEPLTNKSFFKYYSFGIINKTTWYNSKSRIVYEVLSTDYINYLSKICERLILMYLWSEEFPWIKPIKNLIVEMNSIIEKFQRN